MARKLIRVPVNKFVVLHSSTKLSPIIKYVIIGGKWNSVSQKLSALRIIPFTTNGGFRIE